MIPILMVILMTKSIRNLNTVKRIKKDDYKLNVRKDILELNIIILIINDSILSLIVMILNF